MPGRYVVRLPARAAAAGTRADPVLDTPGLAVPRIAAGGGIERAPPAVVATVTPVPDSASRRGGVPESGWTFAPTSCDPRRVGAADPLLVGRRHVDLQRVRSAICCRPS